MTLDEALEEFGLLQRRRLRGEEGQAVATALAALREYLIDFCGYLETGELSDQDFLQFLFDYYPSEVEPDPDVGDVLRDVAGSFAAWLHERDLAPVAGFAAAQERLRQDVPRIMSAHLQLIQMVRKDGMAAAAEVTSEGGIPLGDLTSGVDRLARLDQLDYERAEEELYTITSLGPSGATLASREREALGEGEAGPVRLPPEIAELLRVGDTLHVEIAPDAQGWEIIEVFGVRPGGYP